MDMSLGFISMPGGPEWLVIFLVILIFFGPKSLPRIGKAIGQGIREFKDASDGITRAIEEEVSSAERADEAGKYEEPTADGASSEGSPDHEQTSHGD